MLKIEIVGREAINAKLTLLPDNIHRSLVRKINALVQMLATRVRQKLSGEVLHVRSGDLRGSIHTKVTETTTSVKGTVYSAGDVKYARIHEYGGTIPAHDIVPNKKKALAFIVDGKQIFARRVHIPEINMPERSYLRSSLEELRPVIIAGLREATKEGVRE